MTVNQFILDRKGLNRHRTTLFKSLLSQDQKPMTLLQWKVLWAFVQGTYDVVSRSRMELRKRMRQKDAERSDEA